MDIDQIHQQLRIFTIFSSELRPGIVALMFLAAVVVIASAATSVARRAMALIVELTRAVAGLSALGVTCLVIAFLVATG